jgi:hypothetical protein
MQWRLFGTQPHQGHSHTGCRVLLLEPLLIRQKKSLFSLLGLELAPDPPTGHKVDLLHDFLATRGDA